MKVRKEKAVVIEKQTGVLRYDLDDGFILETVIPGVSFRIKDLLRGHEGKRIRVTIERLGPKA